MTTGTAGGLCDNSFKPQASQILLTDKRFDGLDGIVFRYVIVESFGKQRALGSVFTFNETININPVRWSHGYCISHHVFTQPHLKAACRNR